MAVGLATFLLHVRGSFAVSCARSAFVNSIAPHRCLALSSSPTAHLCPQIHADRPIDIVGCSRLHHGAIDELDVQTAVCVRIRVKWLGFQPWMTGRLRRLFMIRVDRW